MKSLSKQTQQLGLTLIELVIAMAIGLFLIAGVIEIFIDNKSTFRNAMAQSRLQENGRFAVEFMSAELRLTGNRGCAGPGAPLVNTLSNATNFAWDFNQQLEGYEADSSSTWSPLLDTEISTNTPTGDSDIIVARIPVDAALTIKATTANTSTATTATQGVIAVNDVVMVADCEEAAIFQVTSIASTADNDTYTHIAGAGTPGNNVSSLGKTFDKAGQIRKIATVTYYVDQDSTGKSALWRMEGTNTQEMVEGVENMQILYGIAPTGTEAESYVTANNVTDWNQVTNIRIRFLIASLQDNLSPNSLPYTFNGSTQTPTDKRLRRVFTSTINIRNRG